MRNKGQRAYEARKEGSNWTNAATLSGSKSTQSACMNARAYALRMGLPWPVPQAVNDLPGVTHLSVKATEVVVERLLLEDSKKFTALRAYQLRLQGDSWAQVAKKLGYSSDARACEAGADAARRHSLAWPVPQA